MISVTDLTLILMAAMFLLSAFFGLMPIKLVQYLRKKNASTDITEQKWPSLVLCLLSCFTGGVFLGTCLLHLLPDALNDVAQVKQIYQWKGNYPIAELISCIGFFLVYLVEELVLLCFQQHNHSRDGTLKLKSEDSTKDDFGTSSLSSCNLDKSSGCDCSIGSCRELEISDGVLQDTYKKDKDEDEVCQQIDRSHGLRSIMLVVALSFHCVIEGLAMGVQSTIADVATLFFSIIIHKCIILFSTGVQLTRTHRTHIVIISILLVSMMSPIGSAIGIGVEVSPMNNGAKEMTIMVFDGLSVGTFLYIAFFEVFLHERDNKHNSMLKFFVALIGFAIMAALSAVGDNPVDDDNKCPASCMTIPDTNFTTIGV